MFCDQDDFKIGLETNTRSKLCLVGHKCSLTENIFEDFQLEPEWSA